MNFFLISMIGYILLFSHMTHSLLIKPMTWEFVWALLTGREGVTWSSFIILIVKFRNKRSYVASPPYPTPLPTPPVLQSAIFMFHHNHQHLSSFVHGVSTTSCGRQGYQLSLPLRASVHLHHRLAPSNCHLVWQIMCYLHDYA